MGLQLWQSLQLQKNYFLSCLAASMLQSLFTVDLSYFNTLDLNNSTYWYLFVIAFNSRTHSRVKCHYSFIIQSSSTTILQERRQILTLLFCCNNLKLCIHSNKNEPPFPTFREKNSCKKKRYFFFNMSSLKQLFMQEGRVSFILHELLQQLFCKNKKHNHHGLLVVVVLLLHISEIMHSIKQKHCRTEPYSFAESSFSCMEEERVYILQVLLDVAAIENYALIQIEMERSFTVSQNVHVRRRSWRRRRRRSRKGLRVVVIEQSIDITTEESFWNAAAATQQWIIFSCAKTSVNLC